MAEPRITPVPELVEIIRHSPPTYRTSRMIANPDFARNSNDLINGEANLVDFHRYQLADSLARYTDSPTPSARGRFAPHHRLIDRLRQAVVTVAATERFTNR